mgnify:CR=1 FL=1
MDLRCSEYGFAGKVVIYYYEKSGDVEENL